MTKVHGEIEYQRQDGTWVHSDICPAACQPVFTDEYRKFLHTCLDEWLDKSRGTGQFYIKQEGYAEIGI